MNGLNQISREVPTRNNRCNCSFVTKVVRFIANKLRTDVIMKQNSVGLTKNKVRKSIRF